MCDESGEQISAFRITEDGKGNLMLTPDTSSQMLNLTKTKLDESKNAVEMFWSYPTNTLTLIIETGYTRERQPYAIAFDAESMGDNVTHVYQVLNDKEIEIKADSGKFILESDSNYQVVAKLKSWPEMTTYGTYIRYDVIQK